MANPLPSFPACRLTDACEFWSCSVPPEKLSGQVRGVPLLLPGSGVLCAASQNAASPTRWVMGPGVSPSFLLGAGGARLFRRRRLPLQTAVSGAAGRGPAPSLACPDGFGRRAAQPPSPPLQALSAARGSDETLWRKAAEGRGQSRPGKCRPGLRGGALCFYSLPPDSPDRKRIRFLVLLLQSRGSARPALPPGTCWAPAGRAGHASPLCREILQGQTPILALQDSKATLQVQHGGQSVTFHLDKASLPEARRKLQDLTFGLVEQLQTLEKRLEGAAGLLDGAWADGNAPIREAAPSPPLVTLEERRREPQPSTQREGKSPVALKRVEGRQRTASGASRLNEAPVKFCRNCPRQLKHKHV